jgi:hypothetical protein
MPFKDKETAEAIARVARRLLSKERSTGRKTRNVLLKRIGNGVSGTSKS